MAAFAHAVLATAALLVSIACLFAAPLLAGIADGVAPRLAGAATGRSPLDRYRRVGALLATEGIAAPSEGAVVGGALALAFGATATAALTVPCFATGTPLTRFGDLPLVAALLVVGRLAALAAELAPGGSGAIQAAAAGPGPAVGLLPAFLPVAVAVAALGAARTDALPAALHAADAPTRILLLGAVALALLADRNGERHLGAALSGPLLALAEVTAALRLLVFLDLGGLFLSPPLPIADALGGPLAWGGSLVVWAVRSAVLAALLGAAEAAIGRLRAGAGVVLLGGATLLALGAAAFVFVGQSFA